MKYIKILIIAGGKKDFYNHSIEMSKYIAEKLNSIGYKCSIIEFKNTISCLESIILQSDNYDCIFNGLLCYDSFLGAFKNLSNFFKINITQSEVLGFETISDEVKTIQIVESLGILCPLSFQMKLKEYKKEELKNHNNLKHFIKTLNNINLYKSFIVKDQDAKNKAIDYYTIHNCNDILVKEYIKGEDVYVLVLCGNSLGVLSVVPCIQGVVIQQMNYNDYYIKNIDDVDLVESLQYKAERIYNSLGLKNGISLIHFKYDIDKNIYFLSVNACPDLGKNSLVNNICKNNNIDIVDVMKVLINNS